MQNSRVQGELDPLPLPLYPYCHMPFTRLFMGGPDVLERGIRLCAANNIVLPFSETELMRLR